VVYPILRVADVKIQGSDTAITAHYPLNWETTPVWLKVGNAVKINFVGGVRGRIELIGHGSTIPTPQPESTAIPPVTGDDGTITGYGELSPTSPASMDVNVAAGSVRIDGITYSYSAAVITVSAAPAAGRYRYDIIVVGADGVVDYVEGTSATSNPVAPVVPSNHIQIGRILVWHNSTSISYPNFEKSWAEPFANGLTMTFSKDHMHWEDAVAAVVTLTVVDQYGEAITPANAGYDHFDFTLAYIIGNGNIDATPSPTPITKSGTTHSYATFNYTRNNLITDTSPYFYGSVNTTVALGITGKIILLDELDEEMWGEGTGSSVGIIPPGAVEGNIPTFPPGGSGSWVDSGVPIADIIAAIAAMHAAVTVGEGLTIVGQHITLDEAGHVAVTAGTGISLDGQEVSLAERNANLTVFPEYPGAVMTPSGSDNDPGDEGMTSNFEAVGTSIYNYYEWSSDVVSGLQSYDINVKIPIPYNFHALQAGASVALTIDIKTEEIAHTNNLLDITIQRDGNAATSALSSQHSAVAETWVAIGFDDTDAILAALVAGDTLNITIRMYSQASKYCRIGKINLQMILQ
jgi:hypothetical protein